MAVLRAERSGRAHRPPDRPLPGRGRALSTVDPRARRRATVAVAVFAALLYAPTLSYDFVYDDRFLVLGNPRLRSVEGVLGAFREPLFTAGDGVSDRRPYYRPLAHASLAAVHAVAGLRPSAFHLLLVVLNAAACALVFRLILARTEGPRALPCALLAAAVFAAHPVHVEAVAWVSGVMDVGAALCAISALLLFGRLGDPRSHPFTGALLVFTGLLFKESAAAAVPMLWVADAIDRRTPVAKVPLGRWAARHAPLLVAVFAYGALRLSALAGVPLARSRGDLSAPELLASALSLLSEHLAALVLPLSQNAYRLFSVPEGFGSPGPLAGAALLAAALALARFTASTAVRLGVLWTLLPLGLVLYLPALGENAVAERYLYLPSVGAALALAGGLAALEARLPAGVGRRAAAFAAVVLLLLVAGTVIRSRVWRSELSLWEETAGQSPEAAHAHLNLAAAHLRLSRPAEALTALERARALHPSHPDVLNNLAVAYGQAARLEDAAAALAALLAQRPNDAGALHNLGLVERKRGRLESAEAAFRRAVALAPSRADSLAALAELLLRRGERAEARSLAQRALSLSPAQREAAAVLTRLDGGQ